VPRRVPTAPPELSYRAIRADDKAALSDLFERLSARSRRLRFLSPKSGLSARELARFTEVDHRRHEAIVAVAPDGRFAGVARYACPPGVERQADVAFAVADVWQGRGVGSQLACRLLGHARRSGIERLHALTLAENRASRGLLHNLGFAVIGAGPDGLELALSLAGGADAAVRAA
jgi:RimJ/RimL family protein N-acetyltransferase